MMKFEIERRDIRERGE